MSQLTTRVRLYGADCNQSALVVSISRYRPLGNRTNCLSDQLEAIKQTKVDMKVYLGNYVLPSDNEPYKRQRDLIKQAIETYGPDHIAGITVGNEFMLK